MIIIFGTRGTTRPGVLTNYICPSCGKEHAIYAVPQQRYFHIFWIPIFPTSRNYTMVCTECGAMFAPTHMPVTPEIKQHVKTPKWTFFGLFFVVIAFASFLFLGRSVSNERKSDAVAKIENPTIGDIYQVKDRAKEYTLYKVAHFTSDSIYFYPHEYYVEKQRGLDKLSVNDFLDESDEYIEGFSKAELKVDVKDKKIINIY